MTKSISDQLNNVTYTPKKLIITMHEIASYLMFSGIPAILISRGEVKPAGPSLV